jgi:uncharacterized RDD family membrane protein YckC
LPSAEEASAWRDEISVRLNRYRARRKMRSPRYPSLRLPFAPVEEAGAAGASKAASPGAGSPAPGFEPLSEHALALDGRLQKPSAADTDEQPGGDPAVKTASRAAPAENSGAKILEFPRFAWGPPPAPADQLAEPVSGRPRILEVPEVAPPPPALGGITIEADARQEAAKQPGVDIPVQCASLARRALASVIDGLIVALASAMFAVISWKLAAIRPPRIQILGLAAGIPCLFWAAYQYLLLVYAGTTPGLRAAGLELARFDGAPTNRSLRRWRVLASYLSVASLGMGYVWVFLDEDALCWHDRITRTCLAPKRLGAAEAKPAG